MPDTGSGRGRAYPKRRKDLGALLSTGLSSATNAFVGLIAAVFFSVEEYGELSLVVTFVLVLMLLINSFTGEVILAGRPRRSGAADAAMVLGVCAGVGMVLTSGIAGLFIHVPSNVAQLALVGLLGLPGIGLHQCLRYTAFSEERVVLAVRLDAYWLGTSALFVGILWVTSLLTVPLFFAAWVGGAAIAVFASGCGEVAFRSGRLRRAMSWLGSEWKLGLGMGLDHGVRQMGAHGLTLLVGSVVGLAALGGFRFTATIFGPITVIASAVRARVTPMLVQRLHSGSRGGLRALVAPSLFVSLCVAGLYPALRFAWPWLDRLFDPSILREARSLLLPMTVASAALVASLGASVALKVYQQPARLVSARAFNALLAAGLGVVGVFSAGAVGVAWGMAAANVISLTWWWSFAAHAEATELR